MPEYTITLVFKVDFSLEADDAQDAIAQSINAWNDGEVPVPTEPTDVEVTPHPVCRDCGKRIASEDAVWIDKDGNAAGPPTGEPYHVECAPEQPNYDKEN